MQEFQNLPVSVVVKSGKGKIYTLNYATPAALCTYLPEEFEDNELYIMTVSINNQIIWTALGANKPLTIDELIQFFR